MVDDEIPLQEGSHASSSHEVSLEPTTKRREFTSLNPTHPSNEHPTRHTIRKITLAKNENCNRAVRHSGASHWVSDGGTL